MGGTSFSITENGRHKLAKILGFVHWGCILPSFLCLVLALFIQISIEDKIAFIEDYNGFLLPGFLIFTGFYGLVIHVGSGKVAFTCRRPQKWDKWASYLKPIVIATFIVFLVEFIGGIMCFSHIGALEDGFDVGIKKAIAAYKDDATTKEQLDRLQSFYSCCGSDSYRDWLSIQWIHPDYLEDESSSMDVPFSCCNPAILRPCIRKRVHDNEAHYKYDYQTKTTLHETGCTEALMDYFASRVLTVAGALVLSLSFIQVGTTIAGRFLQTAIETAMSNGDHDGDSVAYLLKNPGGVQDADETLNTTTDGETLVTAETTFNTTFADDHDYENLADDHFYENMVNNQENIIDDKEVEDYLAAKFASSREMFEEPLLEEPIYDEVEPVLEEPIYDEVHVDNVMPTSLTKVRSSTGNYMTMDKSNSSRPSYTHEYNRSCFPDHSAAYSTVYKHPYPSPSFCGARPKIPNYQKFTTYEEPFISPVKAPLIIDMAHHFSPQRAPPTYPTYPRHSSPKPRSPPMRYSPPKPRSPPKRYSSPKPRLPPQRYSPLQRYSPKKRRHHSSSRQKRYRLDFNDHMSDLSERQRLLPEQWKVRPVVGGISITSENPRKFPTMKHRSPQRRISPVKTSFRSGISLNCNHSLE